MLARRLILSVALLVIVSTMIFGDVSPSEKRLANKLYTRERTNDLRALGLSQLRSQLGDRPIEQRERRLALMACVYREEDRLLPWGTDLPMPDRDWVRLERINASTALIDGSVLRFMERDECWHAVVWNKKWATVPVHGSLNCLTNAVAVVRLPSDKE